MIITVSRDRTSKFSSLKDSSLRSVLIGDDYYIIDGLRSWNGIGPERHVIAEGYKFTMRLGGEISV